MNQVLWTEVDEYYNGLLVGSDDILEHALKTSDVAGLPQIAVSEAQGKFLYLMALIQKAERILEIGTLAGYSTIWMAKALPQNGKLVTLEYEKNHADVAYQNIEYAGLQNIVDIRVGEALAILPDIQKENNEPFDLIFIDADKPNNPNYFEWSLKLSAPGTIIIADNVVREGKIIESESDDEKIQGIRRFNQMVANEPRVNATVIQTLGNKGYDGFMLIRVMH